MMMLVQSTRSTTIVDQALNAHTHRFDVGELVQYRSYLTSNRPAPCKPSGRADPPALLNATTASSVSVDCMLESLAYPPALLPSPRGRWPLGPAIRGSFDEDDKRRPSGLLLALGGWLRLLSLAGAVPSCRAQRLLALTGKIESLT